LQRQEFAGPLPEEAAKTLETFSVVSANKQNMQIKAIY